MRKVQLYLILAMAVLLGGAVHAQDVSRETLKASLVISYPTKISACEDRMRAIQDFLAELSKHPMAQGYVVVYPPTSPLWMGENRAKQVRSQIRHLNFDPTRVTIVKGDPQGNAETEFWMVPSGAELPPLKRSNGPMSGAPVEQITKPKNFTAENEDPCFWGELWVDGYAAEMNHGWEYPGRVIIHSKNLANFRKTKNELMDLLEEYGVPARRLTFVRKPIPRDGEEGVELWILPVKKGTKSKLDLPGM
jgi:hypothetical protein